MEYEMLNSLSNSIDNVYNYTSNDGARKTISKLEGDCCMSITYITILNSSRESDLQRQIVNLKKEADEMIKSRLKSIKKDFKDNSKRSLISKKISDCDNFETLTVSPYSPFRKLKFSCKYVYEIK